MTLASLRKFVQLALVLTALALCGSTTLAQGSDPNDMKMGSVLFFNKYTSNPTNPQAADTQISITNTNQTESASVHLFFVDGNSCSPADAFIILTPNQTASFMASDFDPGTQGYIVAVAVGSIGGGVSGPIQFNFLIGDLLIRESSGHLANLSAVSIRKNSTTVPNNGNGTATLDFGGDYDRLPGTVAISTFNSQVTHSTLLAIYSPTSNLIFGGASEVSIAALVFDDQEKVYSASFRIQCYNQVPLNSIRVTQGLNNVVPAGRTGWMRLNAGGLPLLGAVLTKGGIFNGAHNLHQLTLTSHTIIVPSF